MTEVLTALGHQWESLVATTLERLPGVIITRRCADVAELLSVSEAGLGAVAVVSSDLRGLDLEVVKRLRDNRIRVLGLHPPDNEESERRLHQLSVNRTLPFDAPTERFALALADDQADDELDVARAAFAVEHGAPGAATDGAPDDVPSGDEPAPWRPRGAREGDPLPSGGGAAASVRRAPERAPVIAVWGPTGAPGRTTIATTLAAELTSRGTPVLLVDADTYGGSIAQALGLLDEAPGISAACRAADQGTLDLPALSRLAPEVVAGLRVLTGLPRAERWLEIRAGALERVLDLSRALVEVVVIDCGFCLEDDQELSYDTIAPRRNEATLTALAASDTVVAVGGADPVALQRLVRGLQELGTVPSGEPVPVVNRVRASAVGNRPQARIADSLLRFAGIERLRFVPDDPTTVDAALLAGRSIVEHAPGSRIRVAIAELATALAPWTAPAEPQRSRGRSARARSRRRGVAPVDVGRADDVHSAGERTASGGTRRSRRVRA